MNQNRDDRYMALAVEEGYHGKGDTAPNPAVGAVVAKDEEVLGVGYHAKAGQPHAEILALEQAGSDAYGAELYVTLEPCCFKGRTPPCTETIINAGITRAIIGTLDPNPKTAGGGVEALRAAGITIELGVSQYDCRELCADFAKFIRTGLPYVTIKYAMSLDGKIATAEKDSRWITSEESRAFVHLLRANHNAVVVGKNTAMKDDPRLTVRFDGYDIGDGPARVVVASSGDIPLNADLFSDVPNPPLLIACTSSINDETREGYEENGAEVIVVGEKDGRVNLRELLMELGKRDILSVLFEGGGELLGSVIDDGLADKVHAFIAPMIIGGSEAISPIGGVGAAIVNDAIRLETMKVMQRRDGDLEIEGLINDFNQYFPDEV
ncbi:MAG: bifunctional diaminohydroxyphosphoribosylaminopyrimidine deaminase/5-amino-6-(5-phosphoribosylamino)uracil reductase RibD [bacterium]|nr:bifunctional diaminohydroxyphosphoribosylaminopyrimidine deaminase/5-amino-6-(5-phosphoribosylamino)uracil reductase RibD [bacterium]